ncbi:MAG: aldo/keto reductase [Aphanothece sp. CMT-3BRIN-NPC111]|nr:aldo/keto reductase [Aphanothece sp. CMT-3BRIN-NPC111]
MSTILILIFMLNPQVTIVVVPREKFSITERSLTSIYAHTGQPFELIYVDGNSPSPIKEYLQTQAKERGFKLIRSEHFLMPNQARNLALAQVATKYIVFIDNDVVVTAGWLNYLVQCAEETNATIVGPLYLYGEPEQELIHVAGNDECILELEGKRRYSHNLRLANQRLSDLPDPLERKSCNGVEFHCLLVRTDLFERVGQFDEKINVTDHTDLCLLVKQQRELIYTEPNAVVAYLPPPPFSVYDLQFFLWRWDVEDNRNSLKYFCDKWNLPDEDLGVAGYLGFVVRHRQCATQWLKHSVNDKLKLLQKQKEINKKRVYFTINEDVYLEVYWKSWDLGKGSTVAFNAYGEEVLKFDCFGEGSGHCHITLLTPDQRCEPRLFLPEKTVEAQIERAMFELTTNLYYWLQRHPHQRIRKLQLDPVHLQTAITQAHSKMLEYYQQNSSIGRDQKLVNDSETESFNHQAFLRATSNSSKPTEMQYTILGRTKLKVSVMGLGGGGHSRLGQSTGKSESESIAIVCRALDLGINFIDTAESYGTEEIVGKSINSGKREDIVLSTKKTIFYKGRLITPKELVYGLNKSLQRLNTSYIDIYHLHGVKSDEYDYAVTELVPELLKLRDVGKIRFLGITESFTTDPTHQMLERAVIDDCWDVVMAGFNLINQSARERVFAKTISKNIGVLVMFAVRQCLRSPQDFKQTIQELKQRSSINLEVLNEENELEFLFHKSGAVSITDAAYRYCRHEPGVHVTLFGTGSQEHLEANVASFLRSPLSNEDLLRLKEIFQFTGN